MRHLTIAVVLFGAMSMGYLFWHAMTGRLIDLVERSPWVWRGLVAAVLIGVAAAGNLAWAGPRLAYWEIAVADFKTITPPVPAHRVRELLHYDPDTGIFTRRVNVPGTRFKAGARAGSVNPDGRTVIGVGGVSFLGHRLAWLYMTGNYPCRTVQIDHINRDMSDNRWANLRVVSRAENLQNTDVYAGRQRGVSRLSGTRKWRARIQAFGKGYSLGCYEKYSDAMAAYKAARDKLHSGRFDPSLLGADRLPKDRLHNA